jgi:hypothetical protein
VGGGVVVVLVVTVLIASEQKEHGGSDVVSPSPLAVVLASYWAECVVWQICCCAVHKRSDIVSEALTTDVSNFTGQGALKPRSTLRAGVTSSAKHKTQTQNEDVTR